MRNNYKKIIGALSVGLLIVVGIIATYAYLTDQTGTLSNTFTVGKVKIELAEPSWNAENADHKIIPGKTIAKDPTVTVLGGSEAAYVFLKVELSDAFSSLSAKYEINYDSSWKLLKDGSQEKVYYYQAPVTTNQNDIELPSLFKEVKFLSTLTAEDLKELGEGSIKVTGYAIQASGFNSVSDAWAGLTN